MSEEQFDDTITSEENTDQENNKEVDVEAVLAENAKLKSIIIRRKEKEEKNDEKPIINNQNSVDLAKKVERMELRQEGYPEDIIDEIMSQGGKAFIETKLGKLAIERVMEQHNAEKAVDITSTIKSPTGKTISLQDLSGMSSAEMEKLLPKA